MIGQTLGHYRIDSKLGAGGMGEVYRATDTKLNRDVAIKVLPREFSRDPERVARFQREAQVLASLNHPNIAAIYGLEESGGLHYLVLEYVPGETLAGPLPVSEALGIARQMTDALEAAHEKGVMHRDLKPTNVKVTPQGKVKVLDFGLAKAFHEEPAAQDPSRSPTMSAGPTRAGMILGTAAYMSPEQARARPLDRRTDIWSFGCVLYELLTGRQAFGAETISDTLSAVLNREPDWARLPAGTPPAVERLLRRCLQKDPARRLRDIGDAWMETAEQPGVATPKAPHAVVPWAIAALLAVALGVAGWSLWRRPEPRRPVTRMVVPLPAADRLPSQLEPAVAISPDGTRIVYAANRGGRTQLFQRRMDQFEATPILGTEDASMPFFSPDGEWVGFSGAGKLKKVALSGGAPVALCDVPGVRGASWGSDDTIVFTPGITAGVGLARVPASGGTPQVLTTPDAKQGEGGHRWPEFLPGGHTVLFVIWRGATFDDARIGALSLKSGERRTLVEGGTGPRYIPSDPDSPGKGYLVYSRSGELLAAPFDAVKLQVTGRPSPIVERAATHLRSGAAQFSVSAAGSMVYIPGGVEASDQTLVWVDRKGAARPLAPLRRIFSNPRLSPDGRRLAVVVLEGASRDLWVYDIAREAMTRLTFGGNNNTSPAWTPDGKRLAFASATAGPQNLFWKPADGSGTEERLSTSSNTQWPTSWSPDGKWLAYEESRPATASDIWVAPRPEGAGNSGPAKALVQTPFFERGAVIAPGGRWMAYTSNETGNVEVFVQPYSPGPGGSAGGKWQISNGGGHEPVWARNGRELFYRSGNKMIAVDVTTEPSFAAGKPRVLFEGPYFSLTGLTQYDVGPDGRFVMIQGVESGPAPTQFHVVVNWVEELKQKTK